MTITTKREIDNIVLTRKPVGMFYADNDGAGIVACDNSTGDAWIADFPDTEDEESCRGCMGPCGRREGLMPEILKQVQMAETIRELEEIVKLGARMRTAQKAYFGNRTSEKLEESKRLEREFDTRATKKLDEEPKKPTLFG